MVNVAYDAPVDIVAARRRSRRPSGGSTSSPRPGRYDGGFQRFSDALHDRHRHGRATPIERDGKLSGIATGLADLDRMMGGLQPSDLIILAGRPGMGKTSLATNIAFNIAKAYDGETQPDGTIKTVERRHRRLLLARNVGRAARDPHHRRAVGRPLLQDPPRRHHRGRFLHASPTPPARCRRSRFYIDQTGGISIAQLAARARRLKRQRGPRPPGRRLSPAARRLGQDAARTACRR